jgi:hypothetical protein
VRAQSLGQVGHYGLPPRRDFSGTAVCQSDEIETSEPRCATVRNLAESSYCTSHSSGQLLAATYMVGRRERRAAKRKEKGSDLGWAHFVPICLKRWAVSGHSPLKHTELVTEFLRYRSR